MIIIKNIILPLFGILILFCAQTQANESKYSSAIVGKWMFHYVYPDLGYIKGSTEYSHNGTSESYIEIKAGSKNYVIETKGTWKVENDYYIGEITYSDHPAIYKPGRKSKSKIVSITDKEFVYMQDDGTKKVMKRSISEN